MRTAAAGTTCLARGRQDDRRAISTSPGAEGSNPPLRNHSVVHFADELGVIQVKTGSPKNVRSGMFG
jgi:hypothetical protein